MIDAPLTDYNRTLERQVAEGIEAHTQLQHLKALGCPRGQGFWFSAPVAGNELEALLMGESTLPC